MKFKTLKKLAGWAVVFLVAFFVLPPVPREILNRLPKGFLPLLRVIQILVLCVLVALFVIKGPKLIRAFREDTREGPRNKKRRLVNIDMTFGSRDNWLLAFLCGFGLLAGGIISIIEGKPIEWFSLLTAGVFVAEGTFSLREYLSQRSKKGMVGTPAQPRD
jgi:hypothetical protein